MYIRLTGLVVAVLWFFGSPALALDNAAAVFEYHFTNSYEAGQCAANVRNFIRTLKGGGSDLSQISFVSIKNRGYSTFSMVNAEQARKGRSGGETNWYHHVIAVDADGYVYDFDFTTSPRITHFGDYVEAMFLNEPECDTPGTGEFCGGRETKLSQYELEWTRGDELLRSSSPQPYFTGTLEESMQQF